MWTKNLLIDKSILQLIPKKYKSSGVHVASPPKYRTYPNCLFLILFFFLPIKPIDPDFLFYLIFLCFSRFQICMYMKVGTWKFSMKLNLCVCETKTFLFVCYEGEKKEINDKKKLLWFLIVFIFSNNCSRKNI